MTEPSPAAALVDRLHRAVNDHDLEAIAACFATDYACEMPLHPARSFVGRDRVRANWEAILAAVPDLRAAVLRQTSGSDSTGDTAWVEWEQRGTQPDGEDHLVRGTFIFWVDGGVVSESRFYLEAVEQ